MALQEEFEKQGNWLFRYRSNLPIIVFLIGTIFYFYNIYIGDYFFLDNKYEFYYQLFCLLVGFIGLFIRAYTVGHTPKRTSGRNTLTQIADTLNTSGIYSIVRHPLYLGNFFMWLGPTLLTANTLFILAFCLFYWIYYERIMFAEEQFLRRKFDMKYIEWSNNVPAFIPNFKNFIKPEVQFSWKKVILKEKNGLAALLIIFFLMDLGGKLIIDSKNFNSIIFVLCIFSIFYYLIIKILRKYTKVFKSI